MTGKVRQRSTAEERRQTVMSTAIRVFAAKGYYGTSTVEVAQAAGISQGYLYRLYADKEALFIAVVDYCSQRLRDNVAAAMARVTSTDPEAVLDQLRVAYRQLIDDRDLLMVLMQANCAAGVPAIGEAVRQCYATQVEYVRAASGATDEQLRRYFADSLLANVVSAVGADAIDAPWARTLRA
ncbi:hypothetical protein Ade02nite_40710 [Paractinoplanes deccanensis]|uniref:HTH tetR-type domain-containing protein n=1 Tax=Paractinoplanes deccanensis TaxID=113561 RepID=A0ABQ3Y630_9ACTN|nr:TetR/AcrR family transcriptional regulator [Actinoplanes deccanensis]GID75430.1 hypothetical protein Ade02nite_40710 [Actinoplanes deccanensis]